jgi:hypothetical protein
MRHYSSIVILLAVVLASAGIVAAQGAELKVVSSPFTEELDFEVGQTLDLNLRLEGLRWGVLSAGAGDEADWREGKKVKTSFTIELENLTNTSLTFSIIILLEDDRGRQLERIKLKNIKVGAGRYIEDIQKIKVDGGVLAETAKIYIFAEVK